jgi:2-keto-4-pentenoate hydratase/2-oxohepta-3-ene-1,7-dioic acid hydratase in catechol pathway
MPITKPIINRVQFIPFILLMLMSSLTLAQTVVEPFKLMTYSYDGGSAQVGIVLRDNYVIELSEANRNLELDLRYPSLPMPADMIGLVERYEYGLKRRIYEIVNAEVAMDSLISNRPNYIHELAEIRTLPPLLYPGKILNVAVNFYSHIDEQGNPAEIEQARAARRQNRGNPYLFYKSARGAIIANNETVVLPFGRTEIDWEVELATVIGSPAKYVSATNAEDYIFGYTVTIDVSDRGGRPPGGFQGVDWFVGKGHDTFTPMGPWIVPKEFFVNPMEHLHQTLTVDGELMQEALGEDMIHNIFEVIEYASSVMSLYPGDVLSNGTSGGTGMGTAVRGEQRFLKDGEVMEASIVGIGTLHIPVAAETSRPEGTGSQLAPVKSYK